ncbi:MAG TPA: hypothetical protein VN661_00230 [Candidatus Acidoferrales bacterium]|nr:hypothetical protein [Candidatus Acidoferrales bacterium]
MNAIRPGDRGPQSTAVAAALPLPFAMDSMPMRAKLIAARDTLLVLGAQVMFRTMLLFRHWLS